MLSNNEYINKVNELMKQYAGMTDEQLDQVLFDAEKKYTGRPERELLDGPEYYAVGLIRNGYTHYTENHICDIEDLFCNVDNV